MSFEHFKEIMELWFGCFMVLQSYGVLRELRAIHQHLEPTELEEDDE